MTSLRTLDLVPLDPDEIIAGMSGDRFDHSFFWLKVAEVTRRYICSRPFRDTYAEGGFVPGEDVHALVHQTLLNTYDRRRIFLDKVGEARDVVGYFVSWLQQGARWAAPSVLYGDGRQIVVGPHEVFFRCLAKGENPLHIVERQDLLNKTKKAISAGKWSPAQIDALLRLIFSVENEDDPQYAELAKRVGKQDQRMADALRAARAKLRKMTGYR
jgi:hypothetical protein